jgi:hypothetical protein
MEMVIAMADVANNEPQIRVDKSSTKQEQLRVLMGSRDGRNRAGGGGGGASSNQSWMVGLGLWPRRCGQCCLHCHGAARAASRLNFLR